MIIFKKGDLFDQFNTVEAIVNTVNLKGVMGKGIALEFKKRFPHNTEIYKEKCKEKSIDIGNSFVYIRQEEEITKYIINFPTKIDWRKPSKYEYIDAGLDNLVEIINQYEINSIALPALGSGLGQLNWEKTKKIISEKLNHLKDVKIYVYEPVQLTNELQSDNEIISKKRPKLTMDRKKLLLLIHSYNSASSESLATYIQIHQLSYLLSSTNPKLNYNLSKLGPYSNEINDLLLTLKDHHLTSTGQNKDHNALIKVKKSTLASLHDASASSDYLEIKNLITGFEDTKSLLALTVSYWIVFDKITSSFEDNRMQNCFDLIQIWYKGNNLEFDSKLVTRSLNRIFKVATKYENLELEL